MVSWEVENGTGSGRKVLRSHGTHQMLRGPGVKKGRVRSTVPRMKGQLLSSGKDKLSVVVGPENNVVIRCSFLHTERAVICGRAGSGSGKWRMYRPNGGQGADK